jgi:hypothetical protein
VSAPETPKSAIDAVAGTLTLRPGRVPSLACDRPAVGPLLLGRLTRGRRAAMLPDLLGSLFTVCAHAHRQTARRAVLAACGRPVAAAELQRDALAIGLYTTREHLQRLAIDWPRLGEHRDGDAATWLRDAPVIAMAAALSPAQESAWRDAAAALPRWLERRLFGMAPSDWLVRWRAERGDWLERWSAQHPHPVTRVLRAVRPRAQTLRWRGAPLDVPARGEAGWRELAAAIAADTGFASRPLWQGAPAETGPWTRLGASEPMDSAWDRLGARLADLARIAGGAGLAGGALRLAPGEALAWSEMSRGLLVHWVQLEGDDLDPVVARAQRVHVLAPTEWNFHPDGAFARWLAACPPQADDPAVRLATMALDPCLAFTIAHSETSHA